MSSAPEDLKETRLINENQQLVDCEILIKDGGSIKITGDAQIKINGEKI